MKIFTAFFLCLTIPAFPRVLHVGTGQTYSRLELAASAAIPGDTILVHGGEYAGGVYLTDFRGSSSAWMTIRAVPGEQVVFRGGTEAWHLTDAAYVRIAGFIFEGQSGNGVNIDDGGTYDTPSHQILIEDCEWRALNATGNNDQLKLSGVDTFTVRNCRFLNGSAGGSAVDMVGCHNGTFTENRFVNAGSNSIQSKGGSRDILIESNRFSNGGQRALNIGGSTGAQFFRPLNANYEASHIRVHSNIFSGSQAPIAFVGAVFCEVINNTFYLPDKWAIRILQETVGPNYLECGDNLFRNNIVYLGNAAANPTVNIGPNTRPATFVFSHNLWYNSQNSSWSGPNLPSTETGGVLGVDPLFTDASGGIFSLRTLSPAMGKGEDVPQPEKDFSGNRFNRPRSIGAMEGNPLIISVWENTARAPAFLQVFPHPVMDVANISFRIRKECTVTILFIDHLGRSIKLFEDRCYEGDHMIPIEGRNGTAYLNPRAGLLVLKTAEGTVSRPVIWR